MTSMRKAFLFLLFVGFLIESIRAQFVVESNGNVSVKPTSDPVVSDFTINHPGSSDICSYIFTDNTDKDIGLRILKRNSTSNCHNYNTGIHVNAVSEHDSYNKTYGIYTHAHKESGDSNYGASYGIYAVASNSGRHNYGVFGCMSGNNNGAGIYGTVYNWENGLGPVERFAGLFHGNVKSTDAMYATVYNTLSDFRLKENIESIDSESADNLMKLNVVKYNLKQLTIDDGDTATMHYYTDTKLLERKHYGLIAQELKEIYPDLVYEGGDGYLSVNYMELVPILIKSIQELTSKVDALENVNGKAIQRNSVNTGIGGLNLQAILYQNDPNPFTENTTIKCVIPSSVQNAVLYIYDMNGHQIDSRTVTERGNASLTIEGSSLDAGMYLYSLITDGTVVDTKRMILTK